MVSQRTRPNTYVQSKIHQLQRTSTQMKRTRDIGKADVQCPPVPIEDVRASSSPPQSHIHLELTAHKEEDREEARLLVRVDSAKKKLVSVPDWERDLQKALLEDRKRRTACNALLSLAETNTNWSRLIPQDSSYWAL